VPPTRLRPGIPRDLETICLRCLQKDPRRRFTNASALADDLDRFLNGSPVLARPVSTFEHFGRWCRRNPRIAVLAATVLVLLITMVATSTVFAAQLARAHGAAVAAFHGECQKSLELLSDKERAKLVAERATSEARLAHEQIARARNALALLLTQVRSLEDRPDLLEAKRNLLKSVRAVMDDLATEERTSATPADPGLADIPHRHAGDLD
jgi:hypothetical protein